jgi:hypothetical protein
MPRLSGVGLAPSVNAVSLAPCVSVVGLAPNCERSRPGARAAA